MAAADEPLEGERDGRAAREQARGDEFDEGIRIGVHAMSEWAEHTQGQLEAKQRVWRRIIENDRQVIADAQERIDALTKDVESIQAELVRRVLGFTVGDKIAPCAEWAAWFAGQTYSSEFRYVINTTSEYTVYEVHIPQEIVVVRGIPPFAVARAMRAEWLRRQDQPE